MAKSFFSVVFLAVLVAGCGGPTKPLTVEQMGQGDLVQVGELYRMYQFTQKKPPQKLNDLGKVRQMGANGFEALRNGKIVLRYNATLPDTDEEPGKTDSTEVLAYQKEVPENGGYVLLINRNVKKMTADEFKAAPRPAGAKEGDLPEPSSKKK